MSIDYILKAVLCIVAVILIILCLLQSDTNDNALNAFNGQSSLFANSKDRGSKKKITLATYICIFLFIGCIVGIGVF